MSYKNYKDLALKSFRAKKFDMAISYFSLAYEIEPNEEILLLIELCHIAKKNADVVNMRSILALTKEIDKGQISEAISVIQNAKTSLFRELDYEDAITYDDFKNLVKISGDFRQTFQNITFSTRVIIASTDDLIEFVENLVKFDFKDIALNYLESAPEAFLGNKRVEKIMKDLISENNAR